MTILSSTDQQQTDIRDQLARVTSATANLTPGAHKLLINSLNVLGDIGDQVHSIDAGDWTHVHMRAMCALENMEANRLVGQPYEAWGTQLKHELAILAGLISRALDEDEPQPLGDPDHYPGACDDCSCCSAAGCARGDCPTDRLGDSACPCTRIDRVQEQPAALLTGFDVLDIQCALQNAAATDCTTLSTADRQALALLTYDRKACKALPALLVERILDGTYALPVDERRAGLLLRLINRLPAVTDDDVDAWLADGLIPPPQDGPVERVERIIAARAARHNDSTGDALRWALRVIVAEMAHAAPSPISDAEQYAAHEHADRLVEQAARHHQAAEHGEMSSAVTV